MPDNPYTTKRLLARASESRCRTCPPDRVCAWACVQGAGMEEIVIGAALLESGSWAFASAEPLLEPVRAALCDCYNAD